MEIKKLLMIRSVSVLSVTCAMAQTNKTDYYQPSFTKSYETEDDDAVSLFVDEEGKLNNFQRDAGLTLRDEKNTKKTGRKLEKAYEKSYRKQKQLNKLEDRKIKKNERDYLRSNRKENKIS